jgi:hypothetical protein
MILSAKELFTENFDGKLLPIWNNLPKGVSIENGCLHINPELNQHVVITRRDYFRCGAEINVRFDKLADDGTTLYYLGFLNTQAWGQDLCWFTVENHTLTASIKNGRNVQRKNLMKLEEGKDYVLGLNWDDKKAEFTVNGKTIWQMTDTAALPAKALPLILSANTVTSINIAQGAKADLLVKSVKLWENAIVADSKNKVEIKSFNPQKINNGDTSIELSGSVLTLDGPQMTISLELGHGPRLRQIHYWGSNIDMLDEKPGPEFFKVCGRNFSSSASDFEVETVKLEKDGNGLKAIMNLIDKTNKLSAGLSVSINESSNSIWKLEVTNQSKGTRKLQMIFPQIGRINIGGNAAENRYYYPMRTGIEGVVDCDWKQEYGALAWMQLMSVYSPACDARLTAYPKDKSGSYKVLAFKKNTEDNETKGFVRSAEIVYGQEVPNGTVLNFPDGIGMAWYYLQHMLKSGQSITSPETVISVGKGNWKDALREYCTWMRTWLKPLKDTPSWFRRCYSFRCMHPEHFYSEKQKKYNSLENLAGSDVDIIQWAFWDHGDASLEPDQKLPMKARRCIIGDFIPDATRGGLTAFRNEIRLLQKHGIRCTVYTDCRMLHINSETGKKYADAWAACYGSNAAPAGYPGHESLRMTCPYEKNAWMAYAAKRLGELVEETGLDGIYFDETNIAFPCYNPRHKHFRKNQLPQDILLLGQNMDALRKSIRAANKDAILMTEHAGSDYMAQFVDGSWVQTFYTPVYGFCDKYYDDQFLYFFRFYMPEFVLYEWGDSVHGKKRCFFNGMGKDHSGCGTELDRVLREHADAFSSFDIEPHIDSLDRQILINRFRTPGKTVYTLYNSGNNSFSGFVLNIPWTSLEPSTAHYVDVLAEEPAESKYELANMRYVVKANAKDKDVGCIVSFPAILNVKDSEDFWEISVVDRYKNYTLTINNQDCGNFTGGIKKIKKGKAKDKNVLKLWSGKVVIDMLIIKQ